MYSSESRDCAAFLANYDTQSAARVLFNNMHYNLPPWSISILPDCRNVVFNTAKVCNLLSPSVVTQLFAIATSSKDSCMQQRKQVQGDNYFFSSVLVLFLYRWEFKHLRWKCCRQMLRCFHGKVMMKIFLLRMTVQHSLLLVSWSR